MKKLSTYKIKIPLHDRYSQEIGIGYLLAIITWLVYLIIKTSGV